MLMKGALLLLTGFVLSACVTPQRPIPFVPAKEAVWFKFPSDLPVEGQVKIPATIAGAIQLVVDDFVPWDAKPPSGADTSDACLLEQASYDVVAAPEADGVVFVSIWLSSGACGDNHWAMDQGGVYAVDVRNWRILAIQH
jgi:hypothetical protein